MKDSIFHTSLNRSPTAPTRTSPHKIFVNSCRCAPPHSGEGRNGVISFMVGVRSNGGEGNQGKIEPNVAQGVAQDVAQAELPDNSLETAQRLPKEDSDTINQEGSPKSSPKSSPTGSPKNSPTGSPKSSQRIFELIKSNPTITTQEIADELGISKRAVLKNLANMKDKIIHEGASNGGHWKILEGELHK